jgi:exopolysaccharide biosynthesis WecB/TagA/CpsF family protein
MERLNKIKWPKKHNIFGVDVSETTYEEALTLILMAAQKRIPAIIDHMPVHGLIEASRNAHLRSMINNFNMVTPDGQPVRWALNRLYKANLPDRVYGPELMLRICRRSAQLGIGIYLYGSFHHVIENLKTNLIKKFPGLEIVGYYSPPFRKLTSNEDKEVIRKINKSGAGIVFLGLGCPKQEIFAYQHRRSVKAVQICVGAAFDFHSDNKKMAPAWMQQNSLEWLFRVLAEPRRLWRRYLFSNSIFVYNFILQSTGTKKFIKK